MDFTFEWQDANQLLLQIRQMLEERSAAIKRVPETAVRKGAHLLQSIVQEMVPKVTSTLVRNIHVVVTKISDDLIEGRVGTHLQYARYLEEGTGIYGPKHRRIVSKGPYPLKQPQLPLLNGKPQYRWSIAGMKPGGKKGEGPPFARAVAKFLPLYIELIERELAKEAAANG